MPGAVAVSLTKVVDWRTKWLSPKRTARWRVEGPVPGAPTLLFGNFDLGEHGYVVEEFFIEGTARSFSEGPDGVQPAAEAEYRTRLVVARPSDPGACSGTVVVEWLNVSGGGDGCPDWAFMHRHIMRTRSAYVAVSAQRVGIEGGGILGDMGTALKQVAPDRYATLQHPGDAFAFDMFSQAAEALRDHPALLGGAAPACVIAVGESQSAVFLTTYINKVDALAEVYDAFLVHGRGSRGASLVGEMGIQRRDADADLTELASTMARFRQEAADPIVDARVPVITVQSETDVVGMYGFGARCEDSPNTRLWEIAGAAHFDTWGMIAAHDDDGTLSCRAPRRAGWSDRRAARDEVGGAHQLRAPAALRADGRARAPRPVGTRGHAGAARTIACNDRHR